MVIRREEPKSIMITFNGIFKLANNLYRTGGLQQAFKRIIPLAITLAIYFEIPYSIFDQPVKKRFRIFF